MKRQKHNNQLDNVEQVQPSHVEVDKFPVVTATGVPELVSSTADEGPGDSTSRQLEQVAKPCRYYLAGKCRLGQRCRFSHANDNHGNDTVKSRPTQYRSRFQMFKPKPTELMLDKLSATELCRLRNTEIEQLKRRYPKFESIPSDDGDSITPLDMDTGHRVAFVPTDPDWPYDVKEVLLDVFFPKNYPKVALSVKVGPDEQIPETLRRHIEDSTQQWVQSRFESQRKSGQVELAFRPLLRWLDRSMIELFTEGLTQYKRELVARAAGFEFVSASELQQKFAASTEEDTAGIEQEERTASQTDDADGCQQEASVEGEAEVDDGEASPLPARGTAVDPIRRGTEMKLEQLQLRDSAATLQAVQIQLIVACGRCKHQTELAALEGRVNQLQCGRCGHQQLVTYRPALVHQFAAVLGYLDLQECSPFDLVLSESQFRIGCLGCSREMTMMGLPPGQPKDTWCQHCHEKMRLAVENVRFAQLQPAQSPADGNVHKVVVQPVRKAAKDPAIQEGKPLPANGACKHYKKSFRWLRFPCCGKTYPCDLCHDEKESDHEMKYANRMICGFCCKEQAYAVERPCVACSSFLTKKTGSHWEGGQGCRDKIKMAKGDAHKYAGTKKTVSRKAQTSAPATKTTKLRHA